MNMRYGSVRALTVAALLFIAGCSSVPSPRQEEEQVYREVAGHLNPGGTSYRIVNPRNVIDGAEKVGAQLYSNFLAMPNPPANADAIQRSFLHGALAWRLTGIEDIRGYGESSIRISNSGEEPLFHNRAALLVRSDSNGILWAIFGKSNRPLAPSWRNVPAAVDNIIEIDLRPGDAFRILAGSEKIAPYLRNDTLAAFLGEPLDKLLDGLDGTFTFASIPVDKSNPEAVRGNFLMVSLPDTHDKLAALVRKFAAFIPGADVKSDRIVLGTILGKESPKARPVIILSRGRLTLYSSLAAEKAFTSPEKKFIQTEEFKRFSAGLPADGIGFFYSREDCAEVFNMAMEKFKLNFRVPDKIWMPVQFNVLRREGNDFFLTGNSTLDGNQQAVLHQVLLPAATVAIAVKEYLDNRKVVQPAAPVPDTTGECRIKLELFKGALAHYADRHNGAYPAGDGLEGIRALIAGKFLLPETAVCPGADKEDKPAADAKSFGYPNCSYIYFGGFNTKSDPKLPLVSDWPLNHPNAVNVLLVDGTVQKLDLKTSTCKRIVGKLQSMYHYNEAEFRNLIRQADALDKQFHLE